MQHLPRHHQLLLALLQSMLLLWGLAPTAYAAGLDVTIEAPALIEAGERLAVAVELRADRAVTGAPALTLPEGWRSVLPERSIALDAGQGERRRLMLAVPQAAPAGTHTLRWCARGDDGAELACATHAFEVAVRRAVSVTLENVPSALLAGGSAELTVWVENAGNVDAEIDLDADCSDALRCATPKPRVLAAGARAQLPLAVTAAKRKGGRAVIRVALPDAPEARATLEVVGGRVRHDGPRAHGTARVGARLDAQPGVAAALQLAAASGETTASLDATVLVQPGAKLPVDPNIRARVRYRGLDVGVGWDRGAIHRGLYSPTHGAWAHVAAVGRVGAEALVRVDDQGLGARVAAVGRGFGGTARVGAVLQGDVARPWMQVEHRNASAELLLQADGAPLLTSGRAWLPVFGRLSVDWRWARPDADVLGAGSARWSATWERDLARSSVTIGWLSERRELTRAGLRLEADSESDRWHASIRAVAGVTPTRWGRADASLTHRGERAELAFRAAVRDEGRGTAGTAGVTLRSRGESGEQRAAVLLTTTSKAVGALARVGGSHKLGRTTLGGELRAGHQGGATAGASAQLSTRDRAGRNAALELRVDATAADVRAMARVEVTVPVSIPLAARDGATLRGRIADDGAGVAGLRVRVGDRVTTTRSDGSFVVRGVAPGENTFDLIGVPVDRVASLALPMQVTVRDDEGPYLDVDLVQPAHVEVTMEWAPGSRGATPVEGALVTLRRDDQQLRRLIGPDGVARFETLRPGAWSVEVSGQGVLPDGARIDLPATLEISEGEQAAVLATVRPRERRIKMVDLPSR